MTRAPVAGSLPNAYPMYLATASGPPATASWTYIDGLPQLNSQLDSWLLGVLDAKAASTGRRYRPEMALSAGPASLSGPGTTLTGQAIKAAGSFIVYRESEKDTSADGTSTVMSRTFFADTGTGQITPAADLLRPDAVPGINARAADELHPDQRATAAPAVSAMADLVIDGDGTLEVSVPSAQGKGDGTVVRIGPEEAEAALSDVGRRVLSQIRSDAPFSAPAPTPQGLRHINCDLVPCAALTYDDGPDAKNTPQLLAILKEKSTLATFFMLGNNAAANPGVARQVTDAGHIAGNHTYSHPYLTKLSAAGIKSEMDRASAAIKAATGAVPTIMRPPYGAANATVQGVVGMPLILWAVDSQDWLSLNPDVFVPKVLKELKPGAVVLMHDTHAATLSGQAGLITALQADGYHLVTVPQLFEGQALTAGQVYRGRSERQ
ncbi:polysaccharide deacetylase family protein [Pseudarthrobacter sp. N5]|uniref:polysaccharide deacetylase family protein n=1 Tax=Pseudarthrobacter sp. N5 TaxID=3418416 RepID=UPI003CF3A2F6